MMSGNSGAGGADDFRTLPSSNASSSGGRSYQEQIDFEELFASEPLIKPLSPSALGKLIFAAGIGGLVLAWCVLDSWNESVSAALFKTGIAEGTKEEHGEAQYFDSPLTLAFLQFLFMGIFFGVLWWAMSDNAQEDMRNLRSVVCSAHWPVQVMSHVFSIFWLQALMMPAQVMSLGAFSLSRGMEVPLAAAMRSQALRVPFGGHHPKIIGGMLVANVLLFYSYVQMEGCLCIFSGHGIWLTGFALYAIYGLLLALPAVNVVCQEAVIAEFHLNPLLMLSLQNFCACLVFCPVLLLEDVRHAMGMMFNYQEIGLLVLWICIQGAAICFVTTSLMLHLDAFWAVALRSMRVVYWWAWQLVVFYMSTNSLLSISHPKVSGWSFGMIMGFSMVVASMMLDRRAKVGQLQFKGDLMIDSKLAADNDFTKRI